MKTLLTSFETIDKSASTPLYQQIKTAIQREIKTGAWPAGQKLPSENELVAALGVSRMTINRALRDLTQQGLIKRVHGIGSFVADTPRHASLIELRDIALEVAQNGKRHSSKVLSLCLKQANAQVAEQMQLIAGSDVFFLQAVHFQDDVPIQLEERYVNPVLVPEFLGQDYCQITATSYLLKQFRPQELEHIVRAVMPDPATRQALSIAASEPCLQLSRRTWNQQRVVTYVTLTYPSSRYDLGARYASNDFSVRAQPAQI